MELVKVVSVKGKLRVVPEGSEKEGFVRFPRELRLEGKIYAVGNLKKANGHWIAQGGISEVKMGRKMARTKTQKKSEWYIVVEYNGLPDFAGELDGQILKAAKKYRFRESGSGYGGVRDITFTFKGSKEEMSQAAALFKEDLKKMKHKPKLTDCYLLQD